MKPSQLNPGRELDALVAEHVMGLKLSSMPELYFSKDFTRTESGTTTAKLSAIPRYSTDIAAAWEVVEKLRKHPDYVEWSLKCDQFARPLYTCSFCLGLGDEIVENIETAPHAICLAALQAVGYEVKE